MKLKELYEKTASMAALELFNTDETMKVINSEFKQEFLHLNNMTKDIFAKLDIDEQFDILRVYDQYFRLGQPIIEDNEYDLYDNIYKKLSEDDTPIMFEPTVNAWEKVNHSLVMGSLSKCNTLEEVEKWNLKKETINQKKVISEKLDGISLECIYEGGIFKQAITRGDGKVGEDITENAIYFDGIVKELGEKMDCAVRGELVITKENLHSINTILMVAGKDPLKNTRNGVAGMATRFKGRNEEILGMITFIAYEIQIFDIVHTGENVV